VREKIGGWWPLVAIVLFLAAGFWVLYRVWRSPSLVAYGGFAVAVVPLVTGWVAWAWRARTRPAKACPVDRQ